MKWSLAFIVAAFLVPLLGAHYLFHHANRIPIKTRHNGKLYQPPHAPHTLSFSNESYLGKWQLAYIQPQPCNESCKADLKLLSNLHMALGKEKNKLNTRILELQTESAGSLLLLDPKGWLIMQYPSIHNTQGIIKDLQRLLRFSP